MIIEPHIHMVSRTTDDYERLAKAGIVAISEPAFWAGYDRGSAEGFRDYFNHLCNVEYLRAKEVGIEHYCWMCLNPKEAENPELTKDVLELMLEFLDHERVLGIGEIGLHKNTKNEIAAFEQHVALAAERNELVLIHTPHLADKKRGTKIILDILNNEPRLSKDRVILDHLEEHTVGLVRDAGYWCGLTVYPITKCTPARAIDILEVYGAERIWINSAADWGVSDPLSVPNCIMEAKRRGHTEDWIQKIVYDNPNTFLSQSPKWRNA